MDDYGSMIRTALGKIGIRTIKRIGFKMVAPMTVEQATRQFMATPNLENFLERKLLDTGVKEFRDRLDSDCFFVDVDMFRTDAQVSDLPFFIRDSLQGALHLCEQSVRRLRNLPPNKG